MLSGTVLAPGAQVLSPDADGPSFVIAAPPVDMDFGDAPNPYPTTSTFDGARHAVTGPTLGTNRDVDSNGQPTTAADGDDTVGTPDDEDGVTFGSIIMVGQLGATVTVNVQNAPAGARLDAWIDFNADSTWGGAFEQIADYLPVADGDNTITFDVPSWAVDGTTYARFRLSTAGDLATDGAADDGEVEDYAVTIASPAAGTGAFGQQETISTDAGGAWSAVAADVDGDGDMDVLSASYLDSTIAWYENDGGESFMAHPISVGADGAVSVAAADVDGDGDVDVLSASVGDSTIAWYENDGSQNFTAHTISTAASNATSVVAADVDGDGDMDVLSASAGDSKIAWYENDGLEGFTAHTISTAAIEARSVFAADVDGDGDMDVLSASFSDDRIAWYENDGSEGFSAHTISTAANGPVSVFAADVDGNGDMDVLSASSNDDQIAWYENNGNENFTAHTISTAALGAESVAAADVDGDGDMDVLSASFYDHKIAWYENDGSEGFMERTISTAALGAKSVLAADVDGDGDMDVVSASFVDDTVAWYEALRGDLDGDGFVGQTDLDIVLTLWGRSGVDITDPRADVDNDGFVGQTDLDSVLADWGHGTLPPAPALTEATAQEAAWVTYSGPAAVLDVAAVAATSSRPGGLTQGHVAGRVGTPAEAAPTAALRIARRQAAKNAGVRRSGKRVHLEPVILDSTSPSAAIEWVDDLADILALSPIANR